MLYNIAVQYHDSYHGGPVEFLQSFLIYDIWVEYKSREILPLGIILSRLRQRIWAGRVGAKAL
jgi:hypothetical protein